MTRLLDALRTSLHLTGTKEGCGEGECGACSVMLNGRLVNSCLVPLMQADGATIVTIEGIAAHSASRVAQSAQRTAHSGEDLNAVQQAFMEHGGAQCGICTPGMVLAASDLLDRNPQPTLDDVRMALAGNLCRCTGYMRIFESVLAAVQKERALSRASRASRGAAL